MRALVTLVEFPGVVDVEADFGINVDLGGNRNIGIGTDTEDGGRSKTSQAGESSNETHSVLVR